MRHYINCNNPPIPEKPNRYRPDGTYDNSPLDPDYFKKYYQRNLKKPFRCPDCGRTLTSKSNYAKPAGSKSQVTKAS